jgi:hypothetical protein
MACVFRGRTHERLQQDLHDSERNLVACQDQLATLQQNLLVSQQDLLVSRHDLTTSQLDLLVSEQRVRDGDMILSNVFGLLRTPFPSAIMNIRDTALYHRCSYCGFGP